jgi:hypothetical protein
LVERNAVIPSDDFPRLDKAPEPTITGPDDVIVGVGGGRFAECWVTWDNMTVLGQLGLMGS